MTWEFFCDVGYFDMWCVRPVGCRKFGEGFHVVNERSARDLCEYLTRTEPASGTLTEGGDAKQAPGDSLSGAVPQADAQPPVHKKEDK